MDCGRLEKTRGSNVDRMNAHPLVWNVKVHEKVQDVDP